MNRKKHTQLSLHGRKSTVRDVAREAQVSIATVSKVLTSTDSGIRISDATQQRVIDVARKLKYTPNLSARALRRGSKLGSIGLLFPNGYNPWISYVYSEMARDINLALEHHHKSLVIMINPPSRKAHSATENGAIPFFLDHQAFDGVICVHDVSPHLPERLSQLGIPWITLNCQSALDHNSIDSDDVAAVEKCLEYVYNLGHRRIWFLGRSVGHPSYVTKLHTYKTFMKRRGLMVYPDLCRKEKGWVALGDFGEWAVDQILAHPNPPTAIVAYNDTSALALIHVLRERGIRIPEQISIIGCDDIPEAVITRPRLTTMRFPAERMANAAVEMILAIINSTGVPQDSVLVPHELIERDSCIPPS